jgi:hypothetical protein
METTMATYEITYSCGHTEAKQLYGKEAERARYMAWAAAKGVCSACAKADRAAACEAVEVEHDLPALTGSDKQVAWARQIRAEKLAAIMAFIAANREKAPEARREEYDTQAAPTVQAILAKGEARWWIDRRDTPAQTVVVEVMRAVKR